MTADDIARDYPYLSSEQQAQALEISNTTEALMKLVTSADAYPNADVRGMLGRQLVGLRSSAIQMLGQR